MELVNQDSKKLLFEAIDHYSLFTNAQKNLLKILIEIAVDNLVITSMTDLKKLTKATRITLSTGLDLFEKEGVIEIFKSNGVKFTSCQLQQKKLDDIVIHFQKKAQLLKEQL